MTDFIVFLNSTGKLFVDFAFSMLIQSSLLIFALLLLDFIIRRRVRAIFRYCIWMLVLVKLVLPPALSLPTGLGYWLGDKLPFSAIQKSPDVASGILKAEETQAQPAGSLPALNNGIAQSFQPAITPEAMETHKELAVSKSVTADALSSLTLQSQATSEKQLIYLSRHGFIFLGWLAVLAALFLLLTRRLIFVRGLICRAEKADDEILEIFQQCKKDMGISREIDLKYSPVATGPAVCGLFKPTILIPVNLPKDFCSRHLRSILLHELAHIKRGDLQISFAQTLLQIFYFYNLLLWLANSIIRKIREQAVDEMVMVEMGEYAADYPETLLNVSRMAFTRPALGLRLISVIESEKTLTSRIKHILNRPFPKSSKLGFVGFGAVLIAASVLLPMAKAEVLKTPSDYIGSWKGDARIIVNWTKQKHLPIEIEIKSDGTVEGKVGDAELANGQLLEKNWVYTKVFQHKTPYRILADLKGKIIKSENIQRNSVMISLKVENSKINGGLTTSGTKIGSKNNMILSAVGVSLSRTDLGNPDMTAENEKRVNTGFKDVSPRSRLKNNVQDENQPMDRTLYFKLPLAQPRFHWKFTNKDLYLSGSLVLKIIRNGQINKIVVFSNGKITEGWEAICSGSGPKDNAIYFGFQSTAKYLTMPDDKVELELIAREDLDGIGRLQTGVLKAGTHEVKGKLKIYPHSEKARAFIKWQDKWLLNITSEKGWTNSQINLLINDNGSMRPLTKAEKKRIYAGAQTNSFFGYSDISFMEDIVSENNEENHFRNIRIRKDLTKIRIDITEFADESRKQIQSKMTLIPEKRYSNDSYTQCFEHSEKKVFITDGGGNSSHDISKFGRIPREIAIKIRILCYLHNNNANQAGQLKPADAFSEAADVDQFQIVNLKDNSIAYSFELNKMDWGLCRKIIWYNKGSNTLSKSIEYSSFHRPVEFKKLSDPGDSGYLLPYKTVRRYFDNNGNKEKTETLEIFDAAMASVHRKHDYDTIRQNYENDFEIEIPDDYTIINRQSLKSQGNKDIR